MKIVVIGGGKVGLAITEGLVAEGHDITVVDNDPAHVRTISDRFDVMAAEGSATDFSTLRSAGVQDADLVLAATGSDEVNLVCSAAAKSMGARHVMARLREPSYREEQELLRRAFGLSEIFNPDMEAANEIARVLQFPTAARVETFAHGRAELVEYRIPEDSRLNNVALKDLNTRFTAAVLVCAVERGENVYIPNGSFTLAAGDRLGLSGSRKELRRFFSEMHAYQKPVKNVMLMGGSRIAVYLANILLEDKMRVTVVEQSPERCRQLTELIPGATIIQADGCDRDMLEEEGLASADAFVATTGYDEQNLVVSLYADRQGVGKVVTKLSDDRFSAMFADSGLDSFVCPKLLAAGEILRYARATLNAEGSELESLYRLNNDRVEALEFTVDADSAVAGHALKDLKLKKNCLVASVIRTSGTLVPNGNTVLLPGDRVVIVTLDSGYRSLNAVLEKKP